LALDPSRNLPQVTLLPGYCRQLTGLICPSGTLKPVHPRYRLIIEGCGHGKRDKTFGALEQAVRCISLSVPCKHLDR
jgi:hypothetical protein